jgi:O-antigen ligase
MQSIFLQNTIRWKYGPLLLTGVIGVLLGSGVCFIYLNISSLSYATFMALALVAPLIFFIFPNSKKILWFILCLSMPISIDVALNETEHLGGTPGFMVSILDMVLGVLYILWVAEGIRKKNRKTLDLFPQISLPAILLIGLSFLSVLPSKFPDLSIFEIIEIVKMYLLFLYLANNLRKREDVNFIMHSFIVLLLFEGALSYLQHRYDEPFFASSLGGPKWIDGRVSGTWSDFNDAAWYFTFVIPVSLSMLICLEKYKQKIIYGLAFMLSTAALVWTDSRAGWISFGVACLFVVVLVFSNIRKKRALIKIVMVSVALAVLLCPLYPRLYSKIYERFTGEDQGSAESRIPQFEIALRIIKDHPILGVGINNYSEIMWEYDNSAEGLENISRFPVHNIFLHIMAEMGVIGIVVFFWFLAAICIPAIDFICRQSNLHDKHVVIGLIAGIIAFLVHGLVDTASIGSKLFYFVWFYAGIICAVLRLSNGSKGASIGAE